MNKASTNLIKILEENNWYCLPNYNFKRSLDEEIEEVYYYNNTEGIKEVENYCKWCLNNLDLIKEIN